MVLRNWIARGVTSTSESLLKNNRAIGAVLMGVRRVVLFVFFVLTFPVVFVLGIFRVKLSEDAVDGALDVAGVSVLGGFVACEVGEGLAVELCVVDPIEMEVVVEGRGEVLEGGQALLNQLVDLRCVETVSGSGFQLVDTLYESISTPFGGSFFLGKGFEIGLDRIECSAQLGFGGFSGVKLALQFPYVGLDSACCITGQFDLQAVKFDSGHTRRWVCRELGWTNEGEIRIDGDCVSSIHAV
jgi:hypothetical protein